MVHADHLGRPNRITDATKTTVWQATYKLWGEVQSMSGTRSNNLRLPGQVFQIETNLAYNWHRHYDPVTGRYTQPDPLRFVDGPSVYGYAGNSPLMYSDRSGLMMPFFPTPHGIGGWGRGEGAGGDGAGGDWGGSDGDSGGAGTACSQNNSSVRPPIPVAPQHKWHDHESGYQQVGWKQTILLIQHLLSFDGNGSWSPGSPPPPPPPPSPIVRTIKPAVKQLED